MCLKKYLQVFIKNYLDNKYYTKNSNAKNKYLKTVFEKFKFLVQIFKIFEYLIFSIIIFFELKYVVPQRITQVQYNRIIYLFLSMFKSKMELGNAEG